MGGPVVEEELKKEEIADLKDEVVVEDVKVDQRDEDDDDHEDDEKDYGTLTSSDSAKQSRSNKKSGKAMSKLRMKPVTGVRRVTIKRAEKMKKTLKKKAYELGTSHNVPVCVIIYPGPNSEAETYPENQDEARAVIDRYMSIPRCKRNEDLQEEKESRKLKNLESKANSVLDEYSREELVELASRLDDKILRVAERLRYLKTQRLDGSLPESAEFPCENAVLDVESKPASGVVASD